jgi:hypothetical protein
MAVLIDVLVRVKRQQDAGAEKQNQKAYIRAEIAKCRDWRERPA